MNTIFCSISLISLFPLQRCNNTNKVRSIAKGLRALRAAIRVKLIPLVGHLKQRWCKNGIVSPLNETKKANFDCCCGINNKIGGQFVHDHVL